MNFRGTIGRNAALEIFKFPLFTPHDLAAGRSNPESRRLLRGFPGLSREQSHALNSPTAFPRGRSLLSPRFLLTIQPQAQFADRLKPVGTASRSYS